ncbi:FUSC family protein [Rhodococcus koreensis]
MGREDWGLIAAAGGFLAVYMPERSRRTRRRQLPLLALTMLACAGIGVATATSGYVEVAGMWVITVVASAVCIYLRVGIPGPLMPVLIGGMAGRAAAPEAIGGLGEPAPMVLALCCCGLALAYLVSSAPVSLGEIRNSWRTSGPVTAPLLRREGLDAVERTVLMRLWIGATIVAVLLLVAPQDQSYWVFLTLVAVLQGAYVRHLTVVRGVHRMLGTFVGMGLFVAIAALGLGGVGIAIAVGALQFLVELTAVRHYGLGLVFVTPAALLIASAFPGTDDAQFLMWRLEDTIIGSSIAIAIVITEALLDSFSQRRRSCRVANQPVDR